MISKEDFLLFVDDALGDMVSIVEKLGDEAANRRPDVEGLNTPYVTLHHCLGVMEYWAGHVVAGRPTERDRDAELRSAGSVAELASRARQSRQRLAEDLARLDPQAPPATPIGPDDLNEAVGRTQGGILFHVYEELAQHRGQMEVCRDLLGASWVRKVNQSGLPLWADVTAQRGRWVLQLSSEGRWEEVRHHFDERMLASAGVQMLVASWEQVRGAVGEFTDFGQPSVRVEGGHRVVDVPMHFERGRLAGRVAFGPDDTVAGLFFLHPDAARSS